MKTSTQNQKPQKDPISTDAEDVPLHGEMIVTTSWGKVVWTVDATLMSVKLRSVQKIGNGFSPEAFLALLKQHGIVHGIHGEALMVVDGHLKKASFWKGNIEIATGTSPVRAPFPKLPLLETVGDVDIQGNYWQIGVESIHFQNIRDVLDAEDLATVEKPYSQAWMVYPEDVLVEFAEVVDGAGTDVYDTPVPVATDGQFVAGSGVKREGQQLKAEIWGLVMYEGKTLSVLPPLWISPDKMRAFYVHFDSLTSLQPVSKTYLIHALTTLGIDQDLIRENLDQVLGDLAGIKKHTAVLVAQGVPPVHGEDARLIYEVDLSQKPGQVMEDGSIDLRERNLIHNVAENDLIVRKLPAQKGSSGRTLFGDILPATDGQDVVLVAGEGARLSEVEYEGLVVPAVYATLSGAVFMRDGLVSVNPIYRISGDVDYETGNVDFEKDVHIVGSVKTGFEVRAGGAVTIGGTIESGAFVRAKGNLTVGRGIVGKTTRVVVMGELRAQFIQNAVVVAKGNLWCGRYIHNAQVRCGGKLTVPAGGGGRSGSVVGGMVCATKGIQVAVVGSDSVGGTILSVQADPEEQAKIEKLKNNVSVCDVQISKLMRSLGVDTLDGEAIKKRAMMLSGKQRDHYVDVIKKLKELSEIRKTRETELDHLNRQVEKVIAGSQIKIDKKLHARSVIRFGMAEKVVDCDEKAITFMFIGRVISDLSEN